MRHTLRVFRGSASDNRRSFSMCPQEQLVFHKEAAEAFSKPAVPFQSCISSGSFTCGYKGPGPPGGGLCSIDWPRDTTTVKPVQFPELWGLSEVLHVWLGYRLYVPHIVYLWDPRVSFLKVSRCENWDMSPLQTSIWTVWTFFSAAQIPCLDSLLTKISRKFFKNEKLVL